ncbi:MAG: hypothetical protein HY908_15520, partial [Myxococcales bacterium]|nr:hypothetical protein [Myxococcales bacterium]
MGALGGESELGARTTGVDGAPGAAASGACVPTGARGAARPSSVEVEGVAAGSADALGPSDAGWAEGDEAAHGRLEDKV